MSKLDAKPFTIPKQLVWEAYKRVKSNNGAPGVDGQSLAEFETDLKGNLYKIWNRMSSGSYFPPPVLGVEIPKADGGVRLLGVPTVADRVAQTVVAMHLEQRAEPRFHPDSYGYRPNKSALDAVGVARQRCWKYNWVIDLDVQRFFDSVPWDLILKAVEAVCDTRWVLLYVRRWLQAPLQAPSGELTERDRGTPQGSAVSPILANLFMHYAFDNWMARTFPGCPFERYADDAVVHCRSERQAHRVLNALAERMNDVGLTLHPNKTKIVYCKDGNRPGNYEHTSFTFLGYEFRPRAARNTKIGVNFTSFLPAISSKALKAKSTELRAMKIHHRTNLTLDELARWLNPIIGGWVNYYGRYYRTALHPLLRRVNTYLRRWAAKKHKRLRAFKRFRKWWTGLTKHQPDLFTHWTVTQAR